MAAADPSSTALTIFYNQGGTHITLGSSNTHPKAGASVTFTATIAASFAGNGTPAGTVAFKDGAKTLGTASLSGGKAVFHYSGLSKGSHSITAAYYGSAAFNPHTSAGVVETVQ